MTNSKPDTSHCVTPSPRRGSACREGARVSRKVNRKQVVMGHIVPGAYIKGGEYIWWEF